MSRLRIRERTLADSGNRAAGPIALDDSGHVTRDKIFVHEGPRGFICVGLGPSARLLSLAERADDLPALKRLDPALAEFYDPYLQRLAVLAKGYNPDQPHVPAGNPDGGEWTSDGGATAATTAAMSSITLVESGHPSVVAGLRLLVSRFSGPTAFLGTLLIPTNQSLISSGALPDNPDVSFRFDRGTGVLTLSRSDDDSILFSGRYGLDSLFRDSNGNAFGRVVDGTVVLDPDALPGYASSSWPQIQTGVGAQAQTETAADQSEPKLCPDPTLDVRGYKSPAAITYQSYVTGLPPGLAVTLTDPLTGDLVSFDGCRESDGTMLEAKGFSYAKFITPSGEWQPWYTGLEDIEGQAIKQSRAAGIRSVEWHIAEPDAVPVFESTIRRLGINNITIIFDPPSAVKISITTHGIFAP